MSLCRGTWASFNSFQPTRGVGNPVPANVGHSTLQRVWKLQLWPTYGFTISHEKWVAKCKGKMHNCNQNWVGITTFTVSIFRGDDSVEPGVGLPAPLGGCCRLGWVQASPWILHSNMILAIALLPFPLPHTQEHRLFPSLWESLVYLGELSIRVHTFLQKLAKSYRVYTVPSSPNNATTTAIG